MSKCSQVVWPSWANQWARHNPPCNHHFHGTPANHAFHVETKEIEQLTPIMPNICKVPALCKMMMVFGHGLLGAALFALSLETSRLHFIVCLLVQFYLLQALRLHNLSGSLQKTCWSKEVDANNNRHNLHIHNICVKNGTTHVMVECTFGTSG